MRDTVNYFKAITVLGLTLPVPNKFLKLILVIFDFVLSQNLSKYG